MSKPQTIARSIGEVAHDLLTLAELQWQLLQCDAYESWQRTVRWLIIAAVGALLVMATFPIALLAVAHVLIEYAELSAAASYGITALCGACLAALLLLLAVSRLTKLANSFDRSREELARNVQWLKRALRQSPPASSARRSDMFGNLQEDFR